MVGTLKKYPGWTIILGAKQEIHSGETLDEQEANDSVGRSRPREANVAGDREVVDGTSGAARSAAVAVTGVGDGLVGAVVGGLSGAVNGLTGGMGAVRGVAPGVAVAAGVAAGALGLVDWPLLVLAGGAALVVRQLRATPASSRAGAVPPRKTTPATTKATASRPRATATTRKTSTPAKRAARKRPNPSTSASSGLGG